MDRRAWWAAVHGVKSGTRLRNLTTIGLISQRLPLLTIRNFLFVVFILQVVCPSFEGEDEI